MTTDKPNLAVYTMENFRNQTAEFFRRNHLEKTTYYLGGGVDGDVYIHPDDPKKCVKVGFIGSEMGREGENLKFLQEIMPELVPMYFEHGDTYLVMERLFPATGKSASQRRYHLGNYKMEHRLRTWGISAWDIHSGNVVVLEDGTFRFVDFESWGLDWARRNKEHVRKCVLKYLARRNRAIRATQTNKTSLVRKRDENCCHPLFYGVCAS